MFTTSRCGRFYYIYYLFLYLFIFARGNNNLTVKGDNSDRVKEHIGKGIIDQSKVWECVLAKLIENTGKLREGRVRSLLNFLFIIFIFMIITNLKLVGKGWV